MEKRGILFLCVCLIIVSLQTIQGTIAPSDGSSLSTVTTPPPHNATSNATTSKMILTAPHESSTSTASTQSTQSSQSTESEQSTQSTVMSTGQPIMSSGVTVLWSSGATSPTSEHPYHGTKTPTTAKGGSASLLGSCGQLLVPVMSVLIYGA